tara:strand:+ start:458 stop:652 length:195 start_codon:yes stop_codon:yes gene_type:complete
MDIGKMTLYEVRYKNGFDLDYFSSREAAEMFIEKYIAKLNVRHPRVEGLWSRDDFEIREKQERG